MLNQVESRSVSLVVFSGRQVIPNLLSVLLRRITKVDLGRVVILHSANESLSALPARKMKEVLDLGAPGLPAVEVTLVEVGIQVQDVLRALRSLIPADLHTERWIINATGGLKTFTLAAQHFIGRANVDVVYQEIGSAWLTLAKAGQDIESRPVAEPIPADLLEFIPVERLLHTQYAAEGAATMRTAQAFSLDAKTFQAVTMQALAHDFDWLLAFKKAGVKFPSDTTPRLGFAFELYMEAALRLMGVRNLCHSFQQVREGDLALTYNNRVVLLDLKLTAATDGSDQSGETPMSEQIYDAWAMGQQYGGLGAKVIMLRPNWSMREPARAEKLDMARKLGVTVLHEKDSASIFSRLGQEIGLPVLSPNLLEMESALRAHTDAGNLVLVRDKRSITRRAVGKARVPTATLDLAAIRDDVVRERGGTFLLYRNALTDYEVFLKKPADITPHAWVGRCDHVRKFLDDLGQRLAPGQQWVTLVDKRPTSVVFLLAREASNVINRSVAQQIRENLARLCG